MVNLVGAVVVSAATTGWVVRSFGWPRLSIPTTTADYRQGGAIALGQTSTSVSAGIDQTLLLRAGFERDNGLYGVGVRIVSYSLLPASAVTTTIYPEFFSKGAEGIEATVAFARRMAKPMVTYGLVILPPLWIGALIVEWLLGNDYDGVAVVIWSMSGFPVLRIMQSLMGDALKGVGRFGAVSGAIMVTALTNVVLNLWWIPEHSWKGAAVATYVSELLYLILLVVALRRARSVIPEQVKPH
ncbi:MAG: polysaccharide biosynthesis C-terminal domain-containing protein [Acidimicrobiales bacterium]